MPKQISVEDARKLQEQGAVYVDVRSQMEFEGGHPADAVNVPLLDHDARSGQVMPNPDFMEVMKANFPADTALLIGCQVGGRSQRAAMMLESIGFTNVANVRGGFSGMRDPMGRTVDPGWADSGLPVETDAPGRTYEDMMKKAGL
jgi:rhodanese-related sulfurtransferase